VLECRCKAQLQKLTDGLNALYGQRHNVGSVLASVLKTCISAGLERSEELKALDRKRIDNPNWFFSNATVNNHKMGHVGDDPTTHHDVIYNAESLPARFKVAPKDGLPVHIHSGSAYGGSLRYGSPVFPSCTSHFPQSF
jgi:hypothetical protein